MYIHVFDFYTHLKKCVAWARNTKWWMFKRHVFLRTFHNYSVASAFIHCQLRMSSSVSCCTRPLFSKCTKLTCDKFMVLPSLCSASSDCPSVLRLCAHLGYHVLTVFRAGAMGLIIMFFLVFKVCRCNKLLKLYICFLLLIWFIFVYRWLYCGSCLFPF